MLISPWFPQQETHAGTWLWVRGAAVSRVPARSGHREQKTVDTGEGTQAALAHILPGLGEGCPGRICSFLAGSVG